MKVEFKRDLETLYEVTNQRLKTIPLFQKLYHIGFIVGPILGILLWRLGVIELEVNNNRCTFIEITSMVILGSIIWFLVFPALYRIFIRGGIKNLYKELVERNLDGGQACIELNEDGVVWKGPYTEQFYAWKYFKKIHGTNDFIYLESVSGPFLWIPKNSFQSDEEATAFFQFASDKYGKN